MEAEDVVEKIAVVQCAGTCEATSVKADYRGIPCGICAQTCPQKIIEIVPDIIRTEVLCSSYHNGPYTKKVCSSGCIGCHKCEKTCPQGAIKVDNFLARIDWDKCTACGACAGVCPTGAMVCGDFSGASRVQPLKKNCGAS